MKKLKVEEENSEDEENEIDYDAGILKIEKIGSLLRQAQDKLAHIAVDENRRIFACHGSDNMIELFLVCSDEEVKKRLQKRAKKERRKNGTGKIMIHYTVLNMTKYVSLRFLGNISKKFLSFLRVHI